MLLLYFTSDAVLSLGCLFFKSPPNPKPVNSKSLGVDPKHYSLNLPRLWQYRSNIEDLYSSAVTFHPVFCNPVQLSPPAPTTPFSFLGRRLHSSPAAIAVVAMSVWDRGARDVIECAGWLNWSNCFCHISSINLRAVTYYSFFFKMLNTSKVFWLNASFS